jgi:hypothetical protein
MSLAEQLDDDLRGLPNENDLVLKKTLFGTFQFMGLKPDDLKGADASRKEEYRKFLEKIVVFSVSVRCMPPEFGGRVVYLSMILASGPAWDIAPVACAHSRATMNTAASCGWSSGLSRTRGPDPHAVYLHGSSDMRTSPLDTPPVTPRRGFMGTSTLDPNWLSVFSPADIFRVEIDAQPSVATECL